MCVPACDLDILQTDITVTLLPALTMLQMNLWALRPVLKVVALLVAVIFIVRLQMHMHGLPVDICLSVCPSVKRVDCDKTR